MGKDAYYFSHDSNAKDDPKCLMLIEQLGLEGYGIYWVLVEILRDQPDYKYPLKLVPAIARKYNTTAEKMNDVIKGYDLFIVEDDEFYSLSLARRMQIMEGQREKRRLAGVKGNQVRWGNTVSSQCDGDANAEQLQIIAKEKKRNETNIIEHPPDSSKSIDDLFEQIWQLYPLKRGKAKVSTAQKKKLHAIGFDELAKAIERYKTDLKMNEWRKPQHGSTFFNSGYVDYLAEDQEEREPKLEPREIKVRMYEL